MNQVQQQQQQHRRKALVPTRSPRQAAGVDARPGVVFHLATGAEPQCHVVHHSPQHPLQPHHHLLPAVLTALDGDDDVRTDEDDDDDDDMHTDDDDDNEHQHQHQHYVAAKDLLRMTLFSDASSSASSDDEDEDEEEYGEMLVPQQQRARAGGDHPAPKRRRVPRPDRIPGGKQNNLGGKKRCLSCGTNKTPYWRDGWDGVVLCNACGIRFQKYHVKCNKCLYIPRKDEKALTSCVRCGSDMPSL